MKGLASTSPSFATVKISGRSARKHYGLESEKSFEAQLHDVSRKSVTLQFRERYPNSFFMLFVL